VPALFPVAILAPCPAEARQLAASVQCGTVRVPLDRASTTRPPRTIRIYFERYRRSDTSRRPSSTVVSIEGGPGYSTTADRGGRVALWEPVSARRDLLLVDLRGP
jgi:hypothetical protein